MPTKTDHIFVIGESADGQTLVKRRDYDLTGVLDEATERITSALPDFSGRIWFVSKKNGKVGTLDRKTGQVKVKTAGRGDRELLRDRQARRLHRLRQAHVPLRRRPRNGRPRDRLEGPLQELRDRQAQPGGRRQRHHADPDGRRLRGDHRQRRADERGRLPARPSTCAGARSGSSARCRSSRRTTGATENSLLAAGRSLIVENNYGYQDPFGPEHRRRHPARLRARRREAQRQRAAGRSGPTGI